LGLRLHIFLWSLQKAPKQCFIAIACGDTITHAEVLPHTTTDERCSEL
jgi:hypothetical protein